MNSAFIHLVPSELASPRPHVASQLLDDGYGLIGALPALRVVLDPAAELLVEGGVLGARSLPGRLNELFIGAQGDVFHGTRPPSVHANCVYEDPAAASGGMLLKQRIDHPAEFCFYFGAAAVPLGMAQARSIRLVETSCAAIASWPWWHNAVGTPSRPRLSTSHHAGTVGAIQQLGRLPDAACAYWSRASSGSWVGTEPYLVVRPKPRASTYDVPSPLMGPGGSFDKRPPVRYFLPRRGRSACGERPARRNNFRCVFTSLSLSPRAGSGVSPGTTSGRAPVAGSGQVGALMMIVSTSGPCW